MYSGSREPILIGSLGSMPLICLLIAAGDEGGTTIEVGGDAPFVVLVLAVIGAGKTIYSGLLCRLNP